MTVLENQFHAINKYLETIQYVININFCFADYIILARVMILTKFSVDLFCLK